MFVKDDGGVMVGRYALGTMVVIASILGDEAELATDIVVDAGAEIFPKVFSYDRAS